MKLTRRDFLVATGAASAAALLAACGSETADNSETNSSANAATGAADTSAAVDGSEAVVTEIDTSAFPKVDVLKLSSTNEISSWCIFQTANKPNDHINCFEPLVGCDCYGNMIPALAASWESSDGDTTWTFTLNPEATWVDANGNFKANVTSEDFKYGMEWILNFWKNDSYLTSSLTTTIKGAKDYLDYTTNLSEDEAYALDMSKFEELVGIETPDDQTIIYHTTTACSYLPSLASGVAFFPLAKGQLDECGVKNFKSIDPMDLWYDGPYICESWVESNSRVYKKNEAYYNKDVKLFEEISIKMVESADVAFEMLKLGEINSLNLNTSTMLSIWNDSTSEWRDKMVKKPATAVVYCLDFNYARNFHDGTPDTNWNKCAANEAFRKCFFYGVDFSQYLMTIDPIDPYGTVSPTVTPKGLTNYSNGSDYVETVMEKAGVTFDGANYPHQDADLLAQYKKQAMEELTAQGVTFPINIELWANSHGTDSMILLGETLVDSLGSDFVSYSLETWVSSPELEYQNPGYHCLMNKTYGCTFMDPISALNQLCTDMNGNAEHANKICHVENCEDAGIVEHFETVTKMVRDADAVVGDPDKRLDGLAEAEAYAIDNCLVIPMGTNCSRLITVTDLFTYPAHTNDHQSGRYVNIDTNADFYTVDIYNQIKAIWEANR